MELTNDSMAHLWDAILSLHLSNQLSRQFSPHCSSFANGFLSGIPNILEQFLRGQQIIISLVKIYFVSHLNV